MAEVSGRQGEPASSDTVSLAPNAGRVTVRYWGSVDGEEQWVEEWLSDRRLPRVVEIRVEPVVRVRVGPGVRSEIPEIAPLLSVALVIPVTRENW